MSDEWADSDDPRLRDLCGYGLREHVRYQDGRDSSAPALIFADADYEVGDGICGLHPDGKQANEPAIVYARADALIDANERIKALQAEIEGLRDWYGHFLAACGYKRDGRPSPECLDEYLSSLQAERDAAVKALKPFACTLERYSGFTEYALFGVWEDVNGAAGRKLNILRKQDFDNAQNIVREESNT